MGATFRVTVKGGLLEPLEHADLPEQLGDPQGYVYAVCNAASF